MSLHFRDFTKAGARAPGKAAARLDAGATLTFTAADCWAMLSRLQSIDLGPEQMKTLHVLGTDARATGKIEIENGFLKALDDPDADNSVANVTRNGDGKTIVNANNGNGE